MCNSSLQKLEIHKVFLRFCASICAKWVPNQTQRSGFGWERSRSRNERPFALCAEGNDMELAATTPSHLGPLNRSFLFFGVPLCYTYGNKNGKSHPRFVSQHSIDLLFCRRWRIAIQTAPQNRCAAQPWRFAVSSVCTNTKVIIGGNYRFVNRLPRLFWEFCNSTWMELHFELEKWNRFPTSGLF